MERAFLVMELLEGRRLLSGYVATALSLRLGGGPNEAGSVVGTDGGTSAYILDSKGNYEHLGLLAGSLVPFPKAINASGEVAGYDEAQYQIPHAFLYHGGTVSPLPEISREGSQALAMNDNGAVVGLVRVFNAASNADIEMPAIWQNKTVQTLGPAGTRGEAHGINNAGTVVGESSPSGGFTNAFIYSAGTMTQLPVPAGVLSSVAFAVNESNQAVGAGFQLNGNMRAILWSNGTATNLGGLPGSTTNDAEAINDSGTVVGQSSSSSFKKAFVWTASGHMVDLNSYFPGAGFTLTDAIGINNAGQILAVGTGTNGAIRDYLLTPAGAPTPPSPPVEVPPVPPPAPPVTNPTPPESGSGATLSYGSVALNLKDASKVNGSGIVAGRGGAGNGLVAATESAAGLMTVAGMLKGGLSSLANDIDSAGEVVGDSVGPGDDPVHKAFLWHGGKMSELIHDAGQDSRAAAMNDSGAIVGSIRTPGGNPMAVLWANKKVNLLGTLGGDRSEAMDINDAGQIVGGASLAMGASEFPFIYSKGKMSELLLLPGAASGVATTLNNVGQVAGALSDSSFKPRATLWSAKKVHDLGTLNGDTWSMAEDMNDSGVVVGQSSQGGSDPRAFVWTAAGHMVDLNSLFNVAGFTLIDARGINDAGQIVAIGRNSTGIERVFLLTPNIASAAKPAAVATSAGAARKADSSLLGADTKSVLE